MNMIQGNKININEMRRSNRRIASKGEECK
jgi:hypothetical protein